MLTKKKKEKKKRLVFMQSLLLNVDVLRRGEHFRHEAEQLCNNEQPSERGE